MAGSARAYRSALPQAARLETAAMAQEGRRPMAPSSSGCGGTITALVEALCEGTGDGPVQGHSALEKHLLARRPGAP